MSAPVSHFEVDDDDKTMIIMEWMTQRPRHKNSNYIIVYTPLA